MEMMLKRCRCDGDLACVSNTAQTKQTANAIRVVMAQALCDGKSGPCQTPLFSRSLRLLMLNFRSGTFWLQGTQPLGCRLHRKRCVPIKTYHYLNFDWFLC